MCFICTCTHIFWKPYTFMAIRIPNQSSVTASAYKVLLLLKKFYAAVIFLFIFIAHFTMAPEYLFSFFILYITLCCLITRSFFH